MILQLKCSDLLRDIHCYIHRIGVNLIFLEACDNFFFSLSGEHPFSSLPPFLLPSGYFRRRHHHPVSPHRHLPAAATLILRGVSALSKLTMKGSKDNKSIASISASLLVTKLRGIQTPCDFRGQNKREMTGTVLPKWE